MGEIAERARQECRRIDCNLTCEVCYLRDAADEIDRLAAENAALREALTEIERLYYAEGKDASWRAAHMRAIATDAIERAALSKGER